MTVPARREAASQLLSLDPPAWFLRHACAVADTAGWLARRIRAAGQAVDVQAVEVAALLHDVDKLAAVRRPAAVRHGDGSAAWLAERGWPELGEIVRDHPVTRLADDEEAARLAAAPLEARIVAYADKRCGQRLGPMGARFASWRRRYPAGPADAPGARRGWSGEVAAKVRERALDLETGVCGAAGVRPEEVRRHRWSRRTLAEAAAARDGARRPAGLSARASGAAAR